MSADLQIADVARAILRSVQALGMSPPPLERRVEERSTFPATNKDFLRHQLIPYRLNTQNASNRGWRRSNSQVRSAAPACCGRPIFGSRIKSPYRAHARHDSYLSRALDSIAQIRLFGKLKLANCARPSPAEPACADAGPPHQSPRLFVNSLFFQCEQSARNHCSLQ